MRPPHVLTTLTLGIFPVRPRQADALGRRPIDARVVADDANGARIYLTITAFVP